MKTRITLKDVVEMPDEEDTYTMWDKFCAVCQYFENFDPKRCSVCKPRIAPPTRWRKAEK